MELEHLRKLVAAFRDERDWKKFHNPKDLAISIIIESAELLEHFQWKNVEEIENLVRLNKEEIAEEMADIAIYLLSLADILDLDLSKAIVDKMEKNSLKYPVEKTKGVTKKYSEL